MRYLICLFLVGCAVGYVPERDLSGQWEATEVEYEYVCSTEWGKYRRYTTTFSFSLECRNEDCSRVIILLPEDAPSVNNFWGDLDAWWAQEGEVAEPREIEIVATQETDDYYQFLGGTGSCASGNVISYGGFSVRNSSYIVGEYFQTYVEGDCAEWHCQASVEFNARR